LANRRHGLGPTALALALIAASGCGGDVPATGERAALPENYKQREKEIMDSMRSSAKVKGRPTPTAHPSSARQ
jgi:hypothetical protein